MPVSVSPLWAQTRHKDIGVLVNRSIRPLEALATTSSKDLGLRKGRIDLPRSDGCLILGCGFPGTSSASTVGSVHGAGRATQSLLVLGTCRRHRLLECAATQFFPPCPPVRSVVDRIELDGVQFTAGRDVRRGPQP